MTVKTGGQMRLTGKEYSGKEGRAGRSKQRDGTGNSSKGRENERE